MNWPLLTSGAVVGTISGLLIRTGRINGRRQWLSPVGRPPRDLFADRRINLFVNTIYEWAWIGTLVAFAGVVMMFPESTDGFAEYVFWLGLAMVVVRIIGVPLCVSRADLNPKYEDQVTASLA